MSKDISHYLHLNYISNLVFDILEETHDIEQHLSDPTCIFMCNNNSTYVTRSFNFLMGLSSLSKEHDSQFYLVHTATVSLGSYYANKLSEILLSNNIAFFAQASSDFQDSFVFMIDHYTFSKAVGNCNLDRGYGYCLLRLLGEDGEYKDTHYADGLRYLHGFGVYTD